MVVAEEEDVRSHQVLPLAFDETSAALVSMSMDRPFNEAAEVPVELG